MYKWWYVAGARVYARTVERGGQGEGEGEREGEGGG